MNEIKQNRGEQIINGFLDTGTDVLINWGQANINENLPKLLDWVAAKVKEKLISNKEGEKIQQDIIRINMDSFNEGVKRGEWRKEASLVWAMQQSGLDKEQIQKVLDTAQKAWEPISLPGTQTLENDAQ